MLKAGLVGCGFMGRMHANVYGSLEGASLVAAVDSKTERGQKLADDFGLKLYGTMKEMAEAEGLDIIDICTPTYLHRDQTVEAASLAKNVFCEKPMALSVAQADEMISACEASGSRLMIGHCIRFWPEYRLLKEIVDSRQLGGLLSINLTRYGGFPAWASDGWNRTEEKSGGGVLDMHIHDTDYVLWLLGEPDDMVSHGVVDQRGPGHVFTTMRYGSVVAHLEGGWNLPPNAPFKMAFRAIFEGGAIIMDAGPMTIYEDGKDPVTPEFPKMAAAGGGNISDLGGYFHELNHFVGKIQSGEPFDVSTPQTSRQSLDWCLREIAQLKSRLG